MPTKQFDAEDFEALLALLPKMEGSCALRHVSDVFVYFINGAKEKAPAAAGALWERPGWRPAA